MAISLNVTCMLSCTLVLKQLQSRTTSYIPEKKLRKNNSSTHGPVPKHWLEFSYICSEYYELDLNLGERKMKTKAYNQPNKDTNIFTITF